MEQEKSSLTIMCAAKPSGSDKATIFSFFYFLSRHFSWSLSVRLPGVRLREIVSALTS
jgi:ABC-type uncharacterized transport system YnjBCD ATPase subunit